MEVNFGQQEFIYKEYEKMARLGDASDPKWKELMTQYNKRLSGEEKLANQAKQHQEEIRSQYYARRLQIADQIAAQGFFPGLTNKQLLRSIEFHGDDINRVVDWGLSQPVLF